MTRSTEFRTVPAGTFDPQLIARYQRRFPGFDEKIVSMYARGMTVREIQRHLEDIYGVDASPALISRITDTVMDAVKEWQARPLDACYPLIFFDATSPSRFPSVSVTIWRLRPFVFLLMSKPRGPPPDQS